MLISMASLGNLLCLSHKETCVGAEGQDVIVREGMTVTAFEEDVDDDGKPDNLIASGTVEQSPKWLRCKGARWVLRIDHRPTMALCPHKALNLEHVENCRQ